MDISPTKTLESQAERVYSLDALRGIMMLLGIVIHASLTYGTVDYGNTWLLKDTKNTSLLFDLIAFLIHVFRMPVFMVAAGYFGALLFYKKGSSGMIRNRIYRILLPFVVSVLIIFPLVRFAVIYSGASIKGEPDAVMKAVEYVSSGDFLPFKTAHLWFIYYLFLFSVTSWLLANIFSRSTLITQTLNNVYIKIIKNFWLRLFFTGILFFTCLYWMGKEYVLTNNTFNIVPSVFVTYFIFYGMGWMLYRSDCLNQLKGYSMVQLVLATVLVLFVLLFKWNNIASALTIKQAIAALYTPLFIFGFISLFLTYFNFYSRRLSYIMDAAYWVYIIHLPIVIFIPGLIANVQLPAFLKFSIVLFATSAICFISYHYFVRNTFIGMFLNGEVHKK